MKRLCNFIIILLSPLIFAQDNFPLNGVKETNQIHHAFINVDIMINYKDKIDNATLLIKGSEILEVGSKVKLPKGTIIHDFEGLTICPSFIEIYVQQFSSSKRVALLQFAIKRKQRLRKSVPIIASRSALSAACRRGPRCKSAR